MKRDPESIKFELEYVRLLLDDLRSLNTSLSDMADPLTMVPVELLPLVFNDVDKDDVAEKVASLASVAMDSLNEAQEAVLRMVNLISGRSRALEAEADATER